MMDKDTHDHENEHLELFFQDARENSPPVTNRLLDAVLADAAELSADRALATKKTAEPKIETGMMRRLMAELKGGSGRFQTAALAACAIAGFVIGVSGGGDIATSFMWGETAAYSDPSEIMTEYFDIAAAEG